MFVCLFWYDCDMSKEDDAPKVRAQLNGQIRQAKHGIGYYIALFIFFFVVPGYVVSQLYFSSRLGWDDLFFVAAFFAIALFALYKELTSYRKVPLWFSVIGVIAGVIVAGLMFFIQR